jgi:hypothetical protein
MTIDISHIITGNPRSTTTTKNNVVRYSIAKSNGWDTMDSQ